ncbi:MAG: DNA polymerase IV [Thermaerobacter sp.]|nr:DNA polymerase IV [Thermaerobacter sp.]
MALIGLCDVNAMFASCAALEDPSLQGQPVLVAGDPKDRRSIVLTASYEARAFGVRTAMPVGMALRLCPTARIVPPDHALYRRYSHLLFETLQEFTPVVAPVSIDEAFMDLTGCPGLAEGPLAFGAAIRARVLEAVGLTVAVGLAPGRWLAKMAADLAKRRTEGVLILGPGDLRQEIWPLPVEAFYGVGPKTAERLRALGIRTIGQIAQSEALAALGRQGEELRRLALGDDPSPVEADGPTKSISHELTFSRDVHRPDELRGVLLGLSDQVAYRLRRAGLYAGSVTLRLKNSRFQSFTRQAALPAPSQHSDALFTLALDLMTRMPHAAFPARLAGVAAGGLGEAAAQAPPLFPDPEAERRERLADTVTALRARYGEGAVLPLETLGSAAAESYDKRRHGTSFEKPDRQKRPKGRPEE